MTIKELIEKIREEIERQIAFLPTVGYSTQVAHEYYSAQNVLKYLLSFLDTIETDELPEGLDEAAGAYAHEYTVNDNGNGGDDWEDDIQRIREELERRLDLYGCLSKETIHPVRLDEERSMLRFLDELEKE